MGDKLLNADVVVVGAGNAALCAAISARENGANVIVLEKAPKHQNGGNSFFTDGAIRFAYRDLEGIQSIVSSLAESLLPQIDMPTYYPEDYYVDLMRVTQEKSDPQLAKLLVDNSFETILWMKKQGVEFELNENQYFETDGKLKFWGGLPVRTKRKGIGLIETLMKRAKEIGIEIIYEAKGVEIKQKANQITGIVIERNDLSRETIKCKSIILACGGFEASKEKRIEYLGEEWKNAVVRGTEYNTGDGIDMALAIGAQMRGDLSGCHAHTTDYNSPRVGDFSKPGDIYKKSSYPLGLMVNLNGERFVDEGADFRNYTYAKYGKETLKQPEQKAFQLYDNQVRSLLRKEYDLEEATIFKANTLEELAIRIGVEKETFLGTIETYNEAVQDGEYKPSVKDGKGTVGITPPKSNWALRLEEEPFYAYPITCGITFTFGGIHVNENGEVLDEEENPIPGLYAAGEMVGGLFYHNYPGGSGLMSGAVFGKVSGLSASIYTSVATLNQVR